MAEEDFVRPHVPLARDAGTAVAFQRAPKHVASFGCDRFKDIFQLGRRLDQSPQMQSAQRRQTRKEAETLKAKGRPVRSGPYVIPLPCVSRAELCQHVLRDSLGHFIVMAEFHHVRSAPLAE